MKLDQAKAIVERTYKTVYQADGEIVKLFDEMHPKADIFNEALNHARVEETGLEIPKVLGVTSVDGKWALTVEYVEGETLEALMKKEPEKLAEYMEAFVELQLNMHEKKVPKLNKLREKLHVQIDSLKGVLDASIRYELATRLDHMPKHTKLCHGDFNPSNVIVRPDGKMFIIDWAHATQGNASSDAGMTYLQFALQDQKMADLYLELFCKKSDTAKQYVQRWLPIVAASRLARNIESEKDFLMKWVDIIDFQ